ncbi:bacteriophage antitermination protein Q [Citrobacter freundii]|uniref:bacteriophage antitermination protein Q n=1 Tax=Citrobacter freundii TaxID=546 RepID=UPI0027987F63|nr:bacteriophage antitermination protein Q [Citrobacter freundii]
MWLMKTLLTSGCTNQRGAGHQYGDLATLVGVNKTNWSQNYVEHYDAMISLYKGLDIQALHNVSRSRSQQKAANYQQGIAEMN